MILLRLVLVILILVILVRLVLVILVRLVLVVLLALVLVRLPLSTIHRRCRRGSRWGGGYHRRIGCGSSSRGSGSSGSRVCRLGLSKYRVKKSHLLNWYKK